MLLAGCSTGPSQEVRVGNAERSYRYTVTLADQLVAHTRETFPDLTFDLNKQAGADDWSACTDENYVNGGQPEVYQWGASRYMTIRPAYPPGTVQLIEPIAQAYIDAGWTIRRDNRDQATSPWFDLTKDGTLISFAARSLDAPPEWNNTLNIHVYGPCLDSPNDLGEFDRNDPDAYFDAH
ncbi:hypothetical protein [Cellulomonas taurus]|uniref:hypothetical protein n=1 Tax=Cellulomonas taurus TaxID=2729175 RepID=UPI00145DF02F|nr:hypothetical protein [Cellulomonas taurus]